MIDKKFLFKTAHENAKRLKKIWGSDGDGLGYRAFFQYALTLAWEVEKSYLVAA